MSKSYQKHQERLAEVQSFGRALARRSRSRCELCEATGERLDPVEIPPTPEEPDIDRCLFLCARCTKGIEKGPTGDPNGWRFLETAIWSELQPAQVAAVRLMGQLAEDGQVAWAREALESLYLDPETQSWVDAT
ncbi:MAG: phnA protein [Myxococcota bacterium]